MKLTASLLLAASMFLGSQTLAADNYQVDPIHSSVNFSIRHLEVSNTHGRFNEPTGSLSIDEADPRRVVEHLHHPSPSR